LKEQKNNTSFFLIFLSYEKFLALEARLFFPFCACVHNTSPSSTVGQDSMQEVAVEAEFQIIII